MTGSDPARIDRLPHTDGMANEIVIPRVHRNSYDHAWRAAGARLVEVGVDDRAVGSGMRSLDPWELEAAIGPDTAAVAYVANRHDEPPLEEVVAVAHRRGVPVLVDAAAQLPPLANLTAFIEAGADLVSFSGGKAIRGPQGTGLLCGRRDLIRAVLLNHLDMDLLLEHWSPPREFFGDGEPPGLPRHGLGRGFKVGKENVMGLLVALRRFVDAGGHPDAEGAQRAVDMLASAAQGRSFLDVEVTSSHGMPRLALRFDSPQDAVTVFRALEGGDPAIAVDPARIGAGILGMDAIGLTETEARMVAERLGEILATFSAEAGTGVSRPTSSGAR